MLKTWDKIKYELAPIVPPYWRMFIAYGAILFIAMMLVSCGHSPSQDDSWLWKAL